VSVTAASGNSQIVDDDGTAPDGLMMICGGGNAGVGCLGMSYRLLVMGRARQRAMVLIAGGIMSVSSVPATYVLAY
jgi:hypothetical protein